MQESITTESVGLRAALIVYLDQQQLIQHETTPEGIESFTFTAEAARHIIVDSDGEHPRIGVPASMRDLVHSPWRGWRPVDAGIALVGYAPGEQGSFELRIPVDPLVMARFDAWAGALLVGLLDIDPPSQTYSINDTISLDRVHLNL